MSIGVRYEERIAEPLADKPAHQFERRRGEGDAGSDPLRFDDAGKIAAARRDIEQDERLIGEIVERYLLLLRQAVGGRPD